ncbi:uncharacterized protein LOC123684023 [Harmonia axyridis]|uniref:uncharacterized protein LOC123684023 n=1 Tax=Harmonia axyridis TaxID=115357 RepID=UPI001E276A1D|nr:uncharacterized protein LOC123684023 [Harmonia axyridis]
MKPVGKKVPSVVVIQERHVRHGENFKLFKVSCRRRREYITKFMSTRRVTYRCKSRKVKIGCGVKETFYKGSPIAISRLLHLQGLDDRFPTFEELNTLNGKQTQGLMGPTAKMDLTIEKKCTSDSLSDFQLIFGSDTNEGEDFESDDEEQTTVEVVFDSAAPSNSKAEDDAEPPDNNKMIVSLARMEKGIKQIINAFEASQNKMPSDIFNEDRPIGAAPTPRLLRNPCDPKPSLYVPTIPLSSRKTQGGGSRSARAFEDILQSTTSSTVNGRHSQPTNLQIHIPPTPPGNQYVLNSGSLGGGGNQLPFRNVSASRTLCGLMEPSGSIPFFRVPGGCFMVIHATNQTTPFLHATFVTGCSNALQFQQIQLPVYNSHQIVAIHLGPYRLCRDEINGVFAFACGTKIYSPCNASSCFK